jgi:site-specific recombinase XerD
MSKQISPLRQRMIEDMAIRNMSPNTQKIYTRAVANFSAFHRQSPDKLGIEDIRAYRLHLMQRGLKASSMYPIIGALRFFYRTTLGQKETRRANPLRTQRGHAACRSDPGSGRAPVEGRAVCTEN